MVSPTDSQYGAAMSPTHPQIDGITISIDDGDEGGAEEPQRPIPPPAYQSQASPFDPMPNHMGWNVPQPGGAMTGAQVYGTPAYNTPGGPPYMVQHPNVPPDAGPYTYPSPPMRYGNWPLQTPYGMDAGTDAGQVSHPPMNYLRGANSPALQVQQGVIANQSPMTTIGLEPNNIGQLGVTGYSSGPHLANIANASSSRQRSNEPNHNPKDWTKDQDALVYSLKTKRKKVKEIRAELKRRFNVDRSENAISKRWKIIKKRYSRAAKVETKTVIQNVMPFLLQQVQSLDTKLGTPQNRHQDPDPQVAEVMHEVEMQQHFEKGLTKVMDEWLFKGCGRHGDANL